jgi:hypothetical protein
MLLVSLTAATAARAEDWRLVSHEDDVRLEVRDRAGSSFEELRLTAGFPGTPARACEAIWAKPAQALEHGYVKREVLRDTGTDRWTYEQFAVPLVSDRDYTVHLWGAAPTGSGCTVSFDLDNEKGPAPKAGVVRMVAMQGTWVVTTAADGGSQVVYTLFNDPGGNVPAFLSRGPQRSKTIDFVKLIRARASQTEAPDAGL